MPAPAGPQNTFTADLSREHAVILLKGVFAGILVYNRALNC